jgi:uncharacterized coiled-coil protein SlyX
MIYLHNNIEYFYPASLADITLKQRIELHLKYGIAFQENIKLINEIEDEQAKSIELAQAQLEYICQCFSYFTTIPIDTIQEELPLQEVSAIYNDSISKALTEEGKIEIKSSYEFAGCKWVVANPQLQPNSKITFNEFLTSKEIVRQLEQLGKGKWYSLLYLCCIYFRKEGEAFDEALAENDGERMKLLLKLPMDVALSVGFFLSSLMNTYLNTLVYSSEVQAKE